ncbi:hypothetical protein LguiA_023725 [Lonicera macranthoides]
MENTKKKQVGTGGGGGGGSGGVSSSSFTAELFGPKDSAPSPSPTGLFGSVFGPSSTGVGRKSSHSGSSVRNQDLGSQYGNPKHGTTDYTSQRGKDETIEPCYFSSSIYYGGQEVYSPNTNSSSASHHTFKKDEGNDDPNGTSSNSASRGNWWQDTKGHGFFNVPMVYAISDDSSWPGLAIP